MSPLCQAAAGAAARGDARRPPPLRRVLPALGLTLVSALAPALAPAQTLQQVYDASRAFDATYLAARANAQSAEYRAAQAEALARPSLSAVASVTAGAVDPPNFGPRSTLAASGGLSGRYPLFNRANGATIEQARRGVAASLAEFDSADQDLIVRVAQAYFDVLAAQDALATTRASKAAITEQLASAKRNFEVGTATITDTREAQARFDLATAQEIAADNDLRTRRVALETLVGAVGVTPRPLQLPVVLPPVTPSDIEAWVGEADGRHPLVRRARVAYEIARLENDKARAGRLPTVDAVAGLTGGDNRGTLATLNRTTGVSLNTSVGVQMNWPLYTGGAVDNRIAETVALEEKARNDLEAARRVVAQGTRTAFLNLQSGLAQVRALEAAEASTKLALEATQLGYRVGVRVNLDVLNAQTQLFQTQRDLARARYDVLVGQLRLRQAAGYLVPGDIALVNRALVP